MKFNKLILKVRAAATPEWAPYFLNYKLLKKRIKDIKAHREGGGGSGGGGGGGGVKCASCSTADEEAHSSRRYSPWVEDISRNSTEKDFFRVLHGELTKVVKFFASVEDEMVVRYTRVKEGVRQLEEQRLEVTNDDLAIMVMSGIKTLTNDLIMLESYAGMSFIGFSKILKKHDKNSGFLTRAQFMSRQVGPQPFVQCAKIKEMIDDLVQMFQRVLAITKPKLLADERLFVSAILDLKDSCERMKKVDDESAADGGLSDDCDNSSVDQEHDNRGMGPGGSSVARSTEGSSSSSSSSSIGKRQAGALFQEEQPGGGGKKGRLLDAWAPAAVVQRSRG